MTSAFARFATRGRRAVGVLICWDQWFPEAARLTALDGAQILFYPTAIGWQFDETAESVDAAQHDAWETVQRAHAIANGVFVAAVNRVGARRTGSVSGASRSWPIRLAGCWPGRRRTRRRRCWSSATSRARREDVRRDWPFLRDRRIDAYADITRRLRDA